MTSLPSPNFCALRAAEILTHHPDRALEAAAWANLASLGEQLRKTALAYAVADAACAFLAGTSADTYAELQRTTQEYLDEQ